MFKYPACCFFYLLSSQLLAMQNNFWECTAHDAQGKAWPITSIYEITAMNKALDACKKQSLQPLSCKSSRETCDFLLNGVSTRPMWQCTALDAFSKVWHSKIYDHQTSAILAAKVYCQSKSMAPESCYAYSIMCKNFNVQEDI